MSHGDEEKGKIADRVEKNDLAFIVVAGNYN